MHFSPDAIAKQILRLNHEGVLISYQSIENPAGNVPVKHKNLIGTRIEDILPSPIGARFQTAFELIRNHHQPQLIRYQIQNGDTVHFYEAHISPIMPDNTDFNLTLNRIASTPQNLPQTAADEACYEALICRLPGALYRCLNDNDWTTLFLSNEIEEFLGYPPSDFLPPNARTLLSLIYEPDRAYVHRLVHEAILRNSSFTIEYRMVHANGSLRWVNEQGHAIFNENGIPETLEGTFLDVTESYKIHENASLHTQLTSVGALGAGVAHEINNALAIMMANLGYALEELEDISEILSDDLRLTAPLNDINHSLTKLDHGMKRIQRIVHDLRSFSDVANNQSPEKIDIVRLIDWALLELLNIQEHTQIIRNFPSEPITLHANQLGLLQVFSHLFTNAYKSFDHPQTSHSLLTITLSKIQNHAILIEISDNGTGIDPNILPRVFEPFFSTRPIGEGTGLGLFVCRGIIHSMKGEILISSKLNTGTTVQLILPTNPSPDHQQ